MSTQRRGVALTPMETRYDIILRTAQLADELGFEAFALPEGWGLDATLLLTEAASRTRRIKLVSGILSVWGRTPGTLAMTAATLHRLSGGRFVLGLGPGPARWSRGSMTSASHTRPTSCARPRSRSAPSWPVNAPCSTPRLGHGRSASASRPPPTYPSGWRRWETAPSGSPPS